MSLRIARNIGTLALLAFAVPCHQESHPDETVDSTTQKVSWNEAVENSDQRQRYLDQLLERLPQNDPYLGSITKLVYSSVPSTDGGLYGDLEQSIASVNTAACMRGKGCPVDVYAKAFDKTIVSTEEELLSILDNESVPALYKRQGTVSFPAITFDSSASPDISLVIGFLEKSSETEFAYHVQELHSSIHQLLMIETGRRTVSPTFRADALGSYGLVREALNTAARNTEYQHAVERLLVYTSYDRMREGKVQLPQIQTLTASTNPL